MSLIKKMQNIMAKLRQRRADFMAPLNINAPEFQVATWFCSGLIIPAPGTWGTLGGYITGLILIPFVPPLALVALAAILFFAGLVSINKIEKKLNEHDSSFIVIDEVVAILLVLGTLPEQSNLYYILSFLIFRFFDALKPWPISRVDRDVKGALGVMADDILAAIFTIAVLWGIYGLI